MRIPYLGSNFNSTSYAHLNGTNSLTTSWTDVVWAAITAGRPGSSHLLAHRWHSLADIVVRTHTIYANLRQRGQFVDRSTLYDALDPTEKGAASYLLGMVMAKLFAAKLFDTPWLFHVSQATVCGTAIAYTKGSKSRPDLIGQNRAGGWLVVEAKGRTNGLDGVALTKAKGQTKMIRTINGSQPHLRLALQAYFDDQLSVRLDDPTEEDSESVEVKIELDAALTRYYSVATAITFKSGLREVVRNQEYVVRSDEESGVTIGVEASILSDIEAGRFGDLRNKLWAADRTISKLASDATVYLDGLLVRLDGRWSSEFMLLEPEARGG